MGESDTNDAPLGFVIKHIGDDAERRVVAWAYIARKADGTLAHDSGGLTTINGVVDPNATTRDVVDTPEALKAFEDSFYDFVSSGMAGADDMHCDFGVAKIVGGLMLTPDVAKSIGIPDGTVPTGALVVIDVPRTPRGDQLWQDIRTGKRKQLSIVAAIQRVPITEAA